MRNFIFQLLNSLKENKENYIVYYSNNKRHVKLYSELYSDIDVCIAKLDYLKSIYDLNILGLIGPTSYDWLVIDLACLKHGIKLAAIPENLPPERIKEILQTINCKLLIADISLKDNLPEDSIDTLYIGYDKNQENKKFWDLPESTINNYNENRILKEYSLAFSSGTSGDLKIITLEFSDLLDYNKKISFYKKVLNLIFYKLSFWSRRDNKVLIFLPFSHSQQRGFLLRALMQKTNVILSNPGECLKHLVLDKPNIMVSVPIIYEIIADRIKVKLHRFNVIQNLLFSFYKFFKINSFSNWNPIKIFFSTLLFNEIRTLYGGRADYFISGSAPIRKETLETFYSVGVKILEAYGQSESDLIAMNTKRHFKIGSVGKPLVEIKIADDSEILIKYDEKKYGSNKNIIKIDDKNFIHTGDLGYIDKKGFLFILGRKDDLIVLESGKKVSPQKLEKDLEQEFPSKRIIVFSKNQRSIYALIEGSPLIKNLAKEKIQKVNENFDKHEKIKGYSFTNESFTSSNGLLTSTLKPKRKIIIERYSNSNFVLLDDN